MIDPAALVKVQRRWRTAAFAGGESAQAAADAAFAGLRDALAILLDNLAGLGYPEVPGLVASAPGLDDRLRRLEAAIGGSVPPVVVRFWQSIGGISLVDLEGYRHVDFWSSRGISGPDGYCDGVYVHACSAEWVEFAVGEFIDLSQELDFPPREEPHLLSLSPDGYHKDKFSGGPSYGVNVDRGWLASWQHFAWTGLRRPVSAPSDPCDFLSYLRTAILECAGFPALLGVPSFEPVLQHLLRNVPIF
jgi:hypothetical protein